MRIIILMLSLVLATASYADSFSKDSSSLKQLGSAWKSYKTLTAKMNSNDLTMGYAGEDVYHRILVTPHRFTG